MDIRDDALRKKKVMTSDGKMIGGVAGLVFDSETFAITQLVVQLDNEAAKEIGAKKPLIGRAELLLPIKKVSGISDAVILRPSYKELAEK
jgi:sporulation protein YlmC with PRC-barrel domain